MLREEKGITLVALIITIIVLVILAAVAIKVALDGGIIQFAAEGVGNYANAAVNENKMWNDVMSYVNGQLDSVWGILSERLSSTSTTESDG